MLFANTVINSPTGNVNIRFGVKSLSSTVSTTFNAGIDAIIYACDYIQSGYSDALCAGGLEEVSYYSLLGLERMGLLSNAGTLKPFARDADGTVMGEGCALFMIESDTRVSGSGATALAQITGYASAFDPNSGRAGYNPSGESARYTIEQALLMAGISPDAIDFIASSANGISSGDALEASVLKAIFGSRPVAAYKTKTGECYGASAALSLACAVSDMKNNRITGTDLSYPGFDDINCVTETLENKKSEHVLVTSFSCDGNCAALVIKNC
jgi:3-oxoacyl-(acyl-carrier-protein) synthase